MDPLPTPPRMFREIVEADLRRAARLVVKVQDEIDPQWRIATPTADWWIATTLPADDRGRATILAALGTFMVWKQALGFMLASELDDPDCVYAGGVTASERQACIANIRRDPRPWTKANFGAVEWLPATSIDPAIANLLPRGPRPVTPKEVAEAERWFGTEGKFPAVHLPSGEVRGLG